MAIAKQITDDRGIIARYHRIHRIEIEGGTIKIKLRTYVNQDLRDAEKNALESNASTQQFYDELHALQEELDKLVLANSEHDHDETIKELSERVNKKSENMPVYQVVIDKYAAESDEEIAYFEPLSISGIYEKLLELPKYKDGKMV